MTNILSAQLSSVQIGTLIMLGLVIFLGGLTLLGLVYLITGGRGAFKLYQLKQRGQTTIGQIIDLKQSLWRSQPNRGRRGWEKKAPVVRFYAPNKDFMYDTFHISQQQAQDILAMLDLHGPVQVTFIRAHNHTYRLDCQQQSFFLKAHTKDWYSPDEPETGYSVAHEASAWAILSTHGLATPDVMLACQGRDNPLRWSFLLTRQIAGTSLVELLEQATLQEIHEMLYAIGEYLRRMHTITFAHAGYIFGNGPTAPPDENSWQHPIWTLQQRQRSTREWIQAKLAHGPAQLLQQLEEQVDKMPAVLSIAYTPPHFVHGDCGPDQIFMKQENGKWQVAAFLDMEVASAGDSSADIVSLCMQLAQRFSPAYRWWLPLFDGYGSIPDFDGIRLRLLVGWYPYMTNIWPGAGDAAFWHILHAKDWDTLFSHAHLKTRD